jgi:hypothetical protein
MRWFLEHMVRDDDFFIVMGVARGSGYAKSLKLTVKIRYTETKSDRENPGFLRKRPFKILETSMIMNYNIDY